MIKDFDFTLFLPHTKQYCLDINSFSLTSINWFIQIVWYTPEMIRKRKRKISQKLIYGNNIKYAYLFIFPLEKSHAHYATNRAKFLPIIIKNLRPPNVQIFMYASRNISCIHNSYEIWDHAHIIEHYSINALYVIIIK